MQNNLQFKDICRPMKVIRFAYNNDGDFKYNNETEEMVKNIGYKNFGEEDSTSFLLHYEIIERWLAYGLVVTSRFEILRSFIVFTFFYFLSKLLDLDLECLSASLCEHIEKKASKKHTFNYDFQISRC